MVNIYFQISENIFDNLPSFAPRRSRALFDEVQLYLSTATEDIKIDPIRWWHVHKKTYPRLYRMALDYLTIPGMLLNIFQNLA
jgi:hAT family C-terminal dimerisation region